jgi:hypothetical protein
LRIRLLFAILITMPARVCIVSFEDWKGMEHAVEVSAETLYEAAALGLKEFRASQFGDEVAPGRSVRLTVAVKREEARHQVSVQQVEDWLQGSGKSPREQALKVRLRESLSAASVESERRKPRALGA